MSKEFDQFDSPTTLTLDSVRMYSHPDLPKDPGVIELSFSDWKVFVCVEADNDTLVCERSLPASHSAYTLELPPSFWDRVVGKTLTTAWKMTNDRGYPDALQLRFRDSPNAGEYTVIQMVAEASQITLTELRITRNFRRLST